MSAFVSFIESPPDRITVVILFVYLSFFIYRCLTKNSNAEVVIHTSKPVCVELYKDYKDLGRFMLRYGGETIAAGVVTEVSGSDFAYLSLLARAFVI